VATRGRQQASGSQQPGAASCPDWTSRPAWTSCPVWPSTDTSGPVGPDGPDAEGRLTNCKSGACKAPTRHQPQNDLTATTDPLLPRAHVHQSRSAVHSLTSFAPTGGPPPSVGGISSPHCRSYCPPHTSSSPLPSPQPPCDNCESGACRTPTRHQPQYDPALHELPVRQPLPPSQPAPQNFLERRTEVAPPSRTAHDLLTPNSMNAHEFVGGTRKSAFPPSDTSTHTARPHTHTAPLPLRIHPLTQRSPPPLPLTSHTDTAPHSHTSPLPSSPPPSPPQHAGPLLINGRPAHLLPLDHPQHTASLSFQSVFHSLPASPLHSSNTFAALADSQQPTYTLVSRPPPASAACYLPATCLLPACYLPAQAALHTRTHQCSHAATHSSSHTLLHSYSHARMRQRSCAVMQSRSSTIMRSHSHALPPPLPRPRPAALPRAHSPSSTTTSAATEAA
jgi:hypothetical protein